MPITKRQFELGIDEDIQEWMRKIYDLLKADREIAFSYEELRHDFLGNSYSYSEGTKLGRALEVLVEISALDKRRVTDTDYYAFHWEFDTDSWILKLDVV